EIVGENMTMLGGRDLGQQSASPQAAQPLQQTTPVSNPAPTAAATTGSNESDDLPF
ncbi:MAG: single-stranded DNA-binding protein, partial [Flavobacteriales bacterium]|nr:single-stranded DNA-binding protein [Flavobacteriales bacterium]